MVELTPTCTRTSWTKDLTILQQDSCPNPFLLSILFLQITLFFLTPDPEASRWDASYLLFLVPSQAAATLSSSGVCHQFQDQVSLSSVAQSLQFCLQDGHKRGGWAGNGMKSPLICFSLQEHHHQTLGGGKERGSLLYTMDTRVPFAAWYN